MGLEGTYLTGKQSRRESIGERRRPVGDDKRGRGKKGKKG